MMLAETLEKVANDNSLAMAKMTSGLALLFNDCASAKWGRRTILRDFFTNQGPRFRPFFTRTVRHARAGVGRSVYPAFKSDR
ncbi:MAG: hypothetical protein NDJ24_04080 [Alphaproteobacteria bacterium]|nr:hypothetical protein [Alphaproteobacteria bacterium]